MIDTRKPASRRAALRRTRERMEMSLAHYAATERHAARLSAQTNGTDKVCTPSQPPTPVK